MVVTTTAVAFILVSIGLAFCGFRFFRALPQAGVGQPKGRVRVLLGGHLLASSVTMGSLGLGSLFFTHNPQALFAVLLFSHIPLTLATVFGVYLTFHIFFPHVSPWPAVVGVALLGAVVFIATIVVHPLPHLTAGNGIDWDMPRLLSILFSYLVLLQIGSELYVFSRLFLQVPAGEVKKLSLFIAGSASLAMINHAVRFTFFLINAPNLQSRVYDLVLAFIGIAFIFIFVPSRTAGRKN
ncbi:MAG: hypothetical protein AAB932_04145 [Patescibacteria group bacterium]